LATVVMVGNTGRNRTGTRANRNGASPAAEDARDNELDLERGLLHRSDERLPRSGGHGQRRPSAVLGIPHHHGLIGAGDFYALATVRT
jgi:hypothetical protein